jgi:hypothetical protein
MKHLALIMVIALILSPAPAAAVSDIREVKWDTETHSTVPANFDIQYAVYQEFKSEPTYHYFYANMASSIKRNQFNDGSGAWVGLLIDADLDGESDYQIEFSGKDLGPSIADFQVYKKMRSSWVAVEKCAGGVFMSSSSNDLTDSYKFLGYKISVDCLRLPKNFAFIFYIDANGDNNRWGVEYGPDRYFQVSQNLSKRYSVPRVAPTATGIPIYKNPQPEVHSNLGFGSPEDQKRLTGLAQIKCNGVIRFGWAPRLDMPNTLKTQGFRTLLVTTYSAVEQCINNGQVIVSGYSGDVVEGEIVNWDATTNLALIAISTVMPQLRWQGEQPRPGWATGIFRGIRNVQPSFESSTISSLTQSQIRMSQPIQPGSDGLPVFDSQGGVLGTVAYVSGTPQGLSTAIPAPQLCARLVACGSARVWGTSLPASPMVASKTGVSEKFSNGSSALSKAALGRLASQFQGLEVRSIECAGNFTKSSGAKGRSLAQRRAQLTCVSLSERFPDASVKTLGAREVLASAADRVSIKVNYKPSY